MGDLACDGTESRSPRWILDTDAPTGNRTSDMDGDQACEYHSRTDSANAAGPPVFAMWHMQCGDSWRDVPLRMSMDSPAQHEGDTKETKGQREEVDAEGVVSGAEARFV